MNSTIHQPPPVLLVGDPGLRHQSAAVALARDPDFRHQLQALRASLRRFREEFGFGRAISAPQIGVAKRFIALHLAGRDHVMVNPRVEYRSTRRFTLWDDCMSFPGLLVRVSRHESITVRFTDEQGTAHCWPRLDRATSELLQHEIDHLDGVLALDRAIGPNPIVDRRVFERDRDEFKRQVD